MFYADETFWVSSNCLMASLVFAKKMNYYNSKNFPESITKDVEDLNESLDSFDKKFGGSGLMKAIVQRRVVADLVYQVRARHREIAEAKILGFGLYDLSRPITLKAALAFDPWWSDYYVSIHSHLRYMHEIFNVDSIFLDTDTNDKDLKIQYWQPHRIVNYLLEALQKTQILPDVSNLPLEELRELQDKVKLYLLPVRAELQRLTKDLRKLVGDELTDEVLRREAEILVSTDIEPLFIETAALISDQLRNRYKRWLVKSLRVIGLASLVSFDPKLVTTATKDSVELATDIISNLDAVKSTSPTVQLAFSMRKHISK